MKNNMYLHKKNNRVYKVIGIVWDCNSDTWKVSYKLVYAKNKYVPNIGAYKELKTKNDVTYVRSIADFILKFKEITCRVNLNEVDVEVVS